MRTTRLSYCAAERCRRTAARARARSSAPLGTVLRSNQTTKRSTGCALSFLVARLGLVGDASSSPGGSWRFSRRSSAHPARRRSVPTPFPTHRSNPSTGSWKLPIVIALPGGSNGTGVARFRRGARTQRRRRDYSYQQPARPIALGTRRLFARDRGSPARPRHRADAACADAAPLLNDLGGAYLANDKRCSASPRSPIARGSHRERAQSKRRRR